MQLNKSIKHLDIIQTNPEEFNQIQKNRQLVFREKFGKNELDNILYSDNHHDLKASRSVDYRLSIDDIQTLCDCGLLMTNSNSKKKTFAGTYLDLYNNDMPVFITSDSMLYAFHKFYDTFLENLETSVLINQMLNMCDKLLQTIRTIQETDNNRGMLKNLEVYFMIPYVLMQLNNDLKENLITEVILPEPINVLKNELLTYELTADIIDRESKMGYQFDKPIYSRYDSRKGKSFIRYLDLNITEKVLRNIVINSPKYYNILKNFEIPDIYFPINLKFGGHEEFNKFIHAIANYNDIKFDFCGIEINVNGTQFKPRGHYTKTLKHTNYFMAFTWLSKFEICIRKKNQINDNNTNANADIDYNCNSTLICNIIAKICEHQLEAVLKFQEFMLTIIGKSDNYMSSEYLEVINNVLPKFNDLSETIEYLINNKHILHTQICQLLTKQCELTKMGDYVDSETLTAFCLIGKANQIDNIIIQRFVDHVIDDDGVETFRKFPYIFDLIYTLFDNKSVRGLITNAMNNINVKNRDGYKYNNHLEQIKDFCDNHQFANSIYAQELNVLRSLTSDCITDHPFNTNAWGLCKANTQIGHYAELRHDNVLYLDEVRNGMCKCSYPDMLIEPNLKFWSEFLKLVIMMKALVISTSNDHVILCNFENIVNKFILYLNGNRDKQLIEELKSIIKEEYAGSGGSYFDGWYVSLFHSHSDAMMMKPEISSYFTAPEDDRGVGGILHIGTGETKVIYVKYKDDMGDECIYMGPIYSAYEFITPYSERLNDDEWKNRYNAYQSLF